MTEAHPEIIIIKRHAAHEEEHHGGAWKIAFADFMTAMMAFFLVLWIISATDKNTKTLIARYFNPVKVEEPAKAQKGIHGAPEKGATFAAEDGNGAPDAGAPSSERGEGPAENGNENPAKSVEAKRAGAAAHPFTFAPARTQRNLIRQCRNRNCSAILALASTRSPARRRPGLASILRRCLKGTATSAPALTRRCAIRSARLAATVRSMSSPRIRALRSGCGCAKRGGPFDLDRDWSRGPGATVASQQAGESAGAGLAAPSTASLPAPERRRIPSDCRVQSARRLEEASRRRVEADARAATRCPGDRRRNPHQPYRPAKLLHVPGRLRRAATSCPAHDGGDRGEFAKRARAPSSCAGTQMADPIGPRLMTTGACPQRARRWPITC